MGIKHGYTSLKADPGDSTLVGQSKWNADHVMTGGGPLLATVTSTVTVTNSLVETTFGSYTLPVGTLALGEIVRFTAWGRYLNNTAGGSTGTWRLKFGATTMHTTPAINYGQSASQRAWLVRFVLIGTGAATQQSFAELWGTATGWDGGGWTAMGTGESMIGFGSAAEGINSGNKVLALTFQHGTANALISCDCRGALLERTAA
jgi:hypothetical protein